MNFPILSILYKSTEQLRERYSFLLQDTSSQMDDQAGSSFPIVADHVSLRFEDKVLFKNYL